MSELDMSTSQGSTRGGMVGVGDEDAYVTGASTDEELEDDLPLSQRSEREDHHQTQMQHPHDGSLSTNISTTTQRAQISYDDDKRYSYLAKPTTPIPTTTTPPASPGLTAATTPAHSQRVLRSSKQQQHQQPQVSSSPSSTKSDSPVGQPLSLTTRRVNASPAISTAATTAATTVQRSPVVSSEPPSGRVARVIPSPSISSVVGSPSLRGYGVGRRQEGGGFAGMAPLLQKAQTTAQQQQPQPLPSPVVQSLPPMPSPAPTALVAPSPVLTVQQAIGIATTTSVVVSEQTTAIVRSPPLISTSDAITAAATSPSTTAAGQSSMVSPVIQAPPTTVMDASTGSPRIVSAAPTPKPPFPDFSPTISVSNQSPMIIPLPTRDSSPRPMVHISAAPVPMRDSISDSIGFCSQSQHSYEPTTNMQPPRVSRVSAADMINNPSLYSTAVAQSTTTMQPPTASAAASATDSRPRSSSHHSRSGRHSHSTDGHRSHSKDGTTSSSTGEHHHRHHHRHHHKRKHSGDGSATTSGVGATATNGASTNEPQKASRTSRQTSSASSTRVKVEPGTTNSHTMNESKSNDSNRSKSSAAILFPTNDDDFFTLNSFNQKPLPISSTTTRTQIKRGREMPLREIAMERTKNQPTLSKLIDLDSSIPVASLEAKESEALQAEVSDFSREENIANGFMAPNGQPIRAKPELPLVPVSHPNTPQRRRFGERNPLPDDDENMNMNTSGGGGSGSGSNRKRGRGKGSKGFLLAQFESEIQAHESAGRRSLMEQMNSAAMNVSTVGGSVPLQMSDAMVVRVLVCEQHYGLRIALVSLATPQPPPKYSYLHGVGYSSPYHMLLSQMVELSRHAGRLSHTKFSSIPPSLLRIVVFPNEDSPNPNSNVIQLPKLADFPDCFIRIRNPFGFYSLSERCLPCLAGITSWDRITKEVERGQVEQAEANLWKHERQEFKKYAEHDREEGAVLAAADQLAKKSIKQTYAIDIDDVEMADPSILPPPTKTEADMTDVDLPIPRPPVILNETKPDAALLVNHILPIDSSLWSSKHAYYHPNDLPVDRWVEVLKDRQDDMLPLSQLKSHMDPREFMISGLIQKVNWRGINLQPTEDHQHAPSTSHDETPPSFFIQDATGAVVEVEVPVEFVLHWKDVLYGGTGGWVSLLNLDHSNRLREEQSSAFQSLHRSLLPPQLSNQVSNWQILTVSSASAFQLNYYSTITANAKREPQTSEVPETIPCLRQEPITPLNDVVRLTVPSGRCSRIHLQAKMVHLNNHPPIEWQLYLTDVSLQLERQTTTPTSWSVMINITQPHHHRLLDTFFDPTNHGLQLKEFIYMKDVCVEYDPIHQPVPRLWADEYTDLVRLIHPKSAAKQNGLYAQYPAGRKVDPYSLQYMMIPQLPFTPSSILLEPGLPSLTHFVTHGVVSPVLQRHGIFALTGRIVEALKKPDVYSCCSRCKTILLSEYSYYSCATQFDRWKSTKPFICHHCHHVQTFSKADVGSQWQHFVTVQIEIIDDDGQTIGPIPIHLEVAELQDLFSGLEEAAKSVAFHKPEEFKRHVVGRELHCTALFSPQTIQPTSDHTISCAMRRMEHYSPIDLRSSDSIRRLSFQVASAQSQPQQELLSAASQLTQSSTQSGTPTDSPIEQVNLARSIRII